MHGEKEWGASPWVDMEWLPGKKQSAKVYILHEKDAEIGETETYLSAYFCKKK